MTRVLGLGFSLGLALTMPASAAASDCGKSLSQALGGCGNAGGAYMRSCLDRNGLAWDDSIPGIQQLIEEICDDAGSDPAFCDFVEEALTGAVQGVLGTPFVPGVITGGMDDLETIDQCASEALLVMTECMMDVMADFECDPDDYGFDPTLFSVFLPEPYVLDGKAVFADWNRFAEVAGLARYLDLGTLSSAAEGQCHFTEYPGAGAALFTVHADARPGESLVDVHLLEPVDRSPAR